MRGKSSCLCGLEYFAVFFFTKKVAPVFALFNNLFCQIITLMSFFVINFDFEMIYGEVQGNFIGLSSIKEE